MVICQFLAVWDEQPVWHSQMTQRASAELLEKPSQQMWTKPKLGGQTSYLLLISQQVSLQGFMFSRIPEEEIQNIYLRISYDLSGLRCKQCGVVSNQILTLTGQDKMNMPPSRRTLS